MTLAEEFNQRISTLRGVHHDDVTGRLVALLKWLEKEPITNGILDSLTAKVDTAKLFEGAGHRRRPQSNTREEIAAVGLELMRHCSERNAQLLNLCMALNIRGPYGSSNLHDMIEAALTDYIAPLLEYIDLGIQEAAAQYSPGVVADNRFADLLSGNLNKLLPRTAAHLARLAGEFLRRESDVAWQNVGNSCRQILIEFANELYEACGADVPTDIQAANVKGLLKHISTGLFGEGKFRDTLLSVVDSVWNHTQSITHRNVTSKQDAMRAFLWTGLVISEFVEPLQVYLEK